MAEARLADASPLVRAMAVWALGELLEARDFAALGDRHLPHEPDPDVRAEWQAVPAAAPDAARAAPS